MPQISVVIPIYNTEKFLAACLESVLSQSFRDFEAILVNDGSTDSSASIIKAFAEKDERIVAIEQENKGLSEARNAGLAIARGNWIAFIDSDDMVAPDFLQALLDAATANDAEIACCGKQSFPDTAQPALPEPSAHSKRKSARIMRPQQALENALYQTNAPDYSAWNKLYSAGLWTNRRFPPGAFFEDVATIPQVFLDSKRVVFVAESLYLYRKRSTSILATPYSRKKAELLDIAESVCKLVRNHDKRLQKAAQSNLFSASCSILMRTNDSPEFEDYRKRAWNNIKSTRVCTIFNINSRFRNKIAGLLSFLGEKNLNSVLRRFL